MTKPVATPSLRPPEELRPSTRLLDLLPGIYRQRDQALTLDLDGPVRPPLETLVEVLGGSLDELHDAITSLWDDHFVERAQPAALPLLAELFGARLLSTDPKAQRALIARIVHYRRRKGTLATLEEVLSETSTWDAEVDEGFRSVHVTLDFAHLAPWRGRSAVLWDPIALADALTRRSPSELRPRSDTRRERGPILEPLPGEAIDDTLRRLGRVDTGRHAASPRTLALREWARPDAVLIRTARFVPVELEELEVSPLVGLPHGQRGGFVDPAGRDTPLVWLKPATRPELLGGLTRRHEPEPVEESDQVVAELLTPTALAEDPELAQQAGAFELAIDGVPLVGPKKPAVPRGLLNAQGVGAGGVVRFADPKRPAAGDRFRIWVLASGLVAGDPKNPDRVLLRAELGPNGVIGEVARPDDAGEAISGRTVDLFVERLAGEARRRAADGSWTTLLLAPALGQAVSNAVAVEVAGETWVVRVEQSVASSTNRVVRFVVGQTNWVTELDLPAPLDAVDGISLAVDGSRLYLVAAAEGSLGLWELGGLGAAPSLSRRDIGSPRQPKARRSPSLCVSAGRLYVYGGELDGAAAGDLWSVDPNGGPWRGHPLRRQQERMGATLLPTAAGLVLVGGEPVPGQLTPECRLWDLATSRAWRALPSLPFEAGLPGALIARERAGGIEVIVWADRTRPATYFLASGASAWTGPSLDSEGPNPPAKGDALFVGDELFVVGPSPLPESDVVFTQGARGMLAVLPSLSLAVGELLRLRVASDGATFRLDDADTQRPRPADTRLGGWFAEERLEGPASDGRYAQPGRLSRRPWTLAQRSLGPWDRLVERAPSDEGKVLLDPRLGRFVLSASAPEGRVTISCRVGRGGLLGPGLVPPGRVIPADLREPEPEFAIATPPDLKLHAGRFTELDPHVYVEPARSGERVTGPEGGRIPVVGELGDALAALPVGALGRVAMLGSARVPSARLTTGVDVGLSLVSADAGSTPVVDRDSDNDLSLLLQTSAEGEPSYFLAGLWLLGRLEVAAERGLLDVRYCQIGEPGRLALWAPGAGHQDLAARRSLPKPELEIRLYGCKLGAVELPPWARLVAAGCTFDAGTRDALAIRAPGASLRLRHCTVHGAVEAGKLEASSSVFAGEVRVDRDDLGFLRHSLFARGGRPPRVFLSLSHTASFVSISPTSPGYLVLAENNGAAAFEAGEGAAMPGAYGERGDHLRELEARTHEFLPIGMEPIQIDRTTFDLYRLSRR